MSEPLSARLDCELSVTIETLNPIPSFKGRGTDYLLRKAHDRGDARRLVCASAGNWGQAMARSDCRHAAVGRRRSAS
ncbi:pyridoxal-phosphate dependent enzyme [Schauerella aestuarii]|uniref:pyridoxal-phosphate dependent enzyme n=1 Tax=Schauerella aestuarii TaxID=2511204 RepID=UPI0038B2E906